MTKDQEGHLRVKRNSTNSEVKTLGPQGGPLTLEGLRAASRVPAAQLSPR